MLRQPLKSLSKGPALTVWQLQCRCRPGICTGSATTAAASSGVRAFTGRCMLIVASLLRACCSGYDSLCAPPERDPARRCTVSAEQFTARLIVFRNVARHHRFELLAGEVEWLLTAKLLASAVG